MTPVVFVSFLFALAWVDLRYTAKRRHTHSQAPSRLPGWLHDVVYRQQQPYQYVRVQQQQQQDSSGSGGHPAQHPDGRWYYHSKQRKLLRMEVADAFEIRGTVLFVLGLLCAAASWGLWRLAWWAYAAALR